jgi:hypothetical protein
MAVTISEHLGSADVLVNTAFASLPRRNVLDVNAGHLFTP